MKHIDPIKEAQAAVALKESLGQLAQDDETLLIDSIEGETEFFDVVDAFLAEIAEDDAMCDAIDAQVSALKARKERFAKRSETRRSLIEQAWIVAELPKVQRPLATIFLSNRAPKVIVETESDIPPKYWKEADPVLDKKLLADDLKARRDALEAIPQEPGEARDKALADFAAEFPEIPGATLSNGTQSLSIRSA